MNTKICFLNKHDTKNNQFKLHSHSCYEVVYFVTGRGKAVVEGKSYEVSAHSYCIIPPYKQHVEAMDGYGEIVFIGFECENPNLCLEEGVYPAGEIAEHSCFNAVFYEYKKQELGFEQAAEYWLRLFLISLMRNRQTEDRKCKDLNYIKAYIEQYSDQKINFRELASLSGYSYDHFRHIFKQKFGVSPQEYRMDIRLNTAKRLLVSTTLSCTEIAYRCGFSNSAQMTAMFKKKFMKTPTAARNAEEYKTFRKS